MEVILLERIEKLGQMGDVVTVKNGYARNFLLPKGMALRATEANRQRFAAQRKEIEARNLERRKEAEAVAKKVDGFKVVLLRQAGESGQLYGSVSSRDVSSELTDAGFHVDRGQVVLERPIKDLGLHAVKVRLHPEVEITVSVNVARSSEEADMQSEAAAKEALIAQKVFESEELAEAAAEVLAETTEEGDAAATDRTDDGDDPDAGTDVPDEDAPNEN